VRDPKDAPVGRRKCDPMVGVRGDVIVKPRRLRVVAASIANMDVWILLLGEIDDDDDDDGDDDDGDGVIVLSSFWLWSSFGDDDDIAEYNT